MKNNGVVGHQMKWNLYPQTISSLHYPNKCTVYLNDWTNETYPVVHVIVAA